MNDNDYSIRASLGSVVLAAAILGMFGLGAAIAVFALLSDWTPYWEQRFGAVGTGGVALALIVLVVWLGRGIVGGIRRRDTIVHVGDGVMSVQDFKGRSTVSLTDVVDVVAIATQGGQRLFVSTKDGRRLSPMFLPISSTWVEEASRLRELILNAKN